MEDTFRPLNVKITDDMVKWNFSQIDKDNSGRISFDEFLKFIKKYNQWSNDWLALIHIEVSFFTIGHKTFKMFQVFWFKEVTIFCEILKIIKRFLSLRFFCFWLNFLQNILYSIRSQFKSINLFDSIHDVFTYLATISRRDISKPTIEGAGCKKVNDRENKKIEVFRPDPRSKMRQISINSHGNP